MLNEIVLNCPDPDGSNGLHRLNIYEWGKGNDEVLICSHGLTRNGRDFDFLALHLQERYRILCPDTSGRGKSEWLKNPADYNYVTYIADMLHMLHELGISKCKWIGTSMGGLIGMMIAANVPGAIEKLVINDIGAFIPASGLERIGEYVGRETVFKNPDEATIYFKEIFAPWGIKSDAHISHMLKYSLKETEKGLTFNYDPNIGAAFRDEKGAPRKMQDINLWDLWEKVTCPVLLLHGRESDILPTDIAKKMATRNFTTLQEYPGIGHAPSLMDEKQIDLISQWIK